MSALQLLDEVGLAARAEHLPAHLSGGEQQSRPAISTRRRGEEVVDLLAGLAAGHGSTVVVAAHDAELAARALRRRHMRPGGS